MKKEEQLLRDLGEIADKFIEEADTQVAQQAPAKKFNISWRYMAAAVACVAAVAVLVNIPEKNNIDLPPMDNLETTVSSDIEEGLSTTSAVSDEKITVSEVVAEETSETAVTTAAEEENDEDEITVRPIGSSLVGTGNVKPAGHTADNQKSYLIINNKAYDHYAVENGYYQLHFLNDTSFQNMINEDIKKASDQIARSYDPGYLAEKDGSLYPFDWVNHIANSSGDNSELERANGIAMEVICENGYLSIALGYLDCDGYISPEEGANRNYGYERCWDVVRTLNYDIINQRKITKFTDLFYEGTDVLSELNKAVFEDNKNDKVNAITDYPELFTIYYILQDNRGEYYNDYTTLLFNDRDFSGQILNSLVTAQYRDMSGYIRSDVASGQLYDEEIPEFRYTTVTEDGVKYSRATASIFRSSDEAEKYISDMTAVQRKAVNEAVSKVGKPSDIYSVTAELRTGDKYQICNVWTVGYAAKEVQFFYDKDTLEELYISDLLGENWKDYLTGGSIENDAQIVGYIMTEDDTVSFNVSWDGNYAQFKAPLSAVNEKYRN